MITNEDILNMNYYKKDKFTGSCQGMRFQVQLEKEEGNDHFLVFAWPGPYTFANTADDKKISATFPFTEDGKQQVVDWLNETFEEKKDMWPKSITV